MINDEITALLDELADLSEAWKKNRAEGRIQPSIRDGMLMICREVVEVTEKE